MVSGLEYIEIDRHLFKMWLSQLDGNMKDVMVILFKVLKNHVSEYEAITIIEEIADCYLKDREIKNEVVK